MQLKAIVYDVKNRSRKPETVGNIFILKKTHLISCAEIRIIDDNNGNYRNTQFSLTLSLLMQDS